MWPERGNFTLLPNQNSMTTSNLSAAFATLTHDDLYGILSALQAKARDTERFLNTQLEPLKAERPSLYKAYVEMFEQETNLYHKFKAIVYDEI